MDNKREPYGVGTSRLNARSYGGEGKSTVDETTTGNCWTVEAMEGRNSRHQERAVDLLAQVAGASSSRRPVAPISSRGPTPTSIGNDMSFSRLGTGTTPVKLETHRQTDARRHGRGERPTTADAGQGPIHAPSSDKRHNLMKQFPIKRPLLRGAPSAVARGTQPCGSGYRVTSLGQPALPNDNLSDSRDMCT